MDELRLECLRMAHDAGMPVADVVARAKAYHGFLIDMTEGAPTNPDKPFSGCVAVSGDRLGHIVSADELIDDYIARCPGLSARIFRDPVDMDALEAGMAQRREKYPHMFNAAGDLLPERARPAAVGRVRRIRQVALRYIRRSLLAVFRGEDPTSKEPVRSTSERRRAADHD